MAFDWPEAFFAPPPVRFVAMPPAEEALAAAAAAIRTAKRPLIVAGGGVLYALATDALRAFAEAHGVPVAETQAGKGALAWDHPLQLGAIGVTGSPAANAAGARGRRRARRRHAAAGLHDGLALAVRPGAARRRSTSIRSTRSSGARGRCARTRGSASPRCRARSRAGARTRPGARTRWRRASAGATRCCASPASATSRLPYDGDVIGAVQRAAGSTHDDIVVCAAGTLPGELHKLWRTVGAGRLPRRVRLLVHGLRDRRRDRREDGAARRAR